VTTFCDATLSVPTNESCCELCDADVRRQRRLVQRQTHLPRWRRRTTLRQVSSGHVASASQHACRNHRLSRSLPLRLRLFAYYITYYSEKIQLECGPMPNVMVALPNIGGALCSAPQSLADAHSWLPRSNAAKTRKPLKLAGVPQTGKLISATSGLKFTIL